MALATNGILGSLAILVHGAFDAVGAGLQEVAAAVAQLVAALQQAATGFSDVVLQHAGVMITGMVAGAAVVLLGLLVTRLMHHSAVTVPSRKPDRTPISVPETKDDLKSLPMAEVEKKLGSSPDGLSQAEATKRLIQYGPNELEEKKQNFFSKYSRIFGDPFRG